MFATDQTIRQTPSLETLNGYLHDYGESVRRFFREQQRSAMISPLFNLPCRLILGSYCYYENLRPLLLELLQHATPEAIGRDMRRLGSRANSIHLNSLMLGYFNGREQLRLLGQQPQDDVDELALILDFWARAAKSYRSDGRHLPDDADFTMPVLSRPDVEDLTARLRGSWPEDIKNKIRRMMATLELYTFILNGEARIGAFHHGPYALANGDVLVVKELIGLRENFFPWAHTDARPGCDAVARVMRLRGVQAKIVLMGSLTTVPSAYEENIVAQAVLRVDGGEIRPVSPEEMDAITEAAAAAQLEIYRRMIDWDDRYRVEYGAELYACILNTFAQGLPLSDFADSIRQNFRSSIDRHLDDLFTGREAPVVLTHIAKTDGPIYSPIVAR
jgi:hypothetical protein